MPSEAPNPRPLAVRNEMGTTPNPERDPMSQRIAFTVPAVPVAQPRARATTINGMARMYEAKKSHPIHDYKASVRMAAAAAYQGPPLPGPLSMSIVCVFSCKTKKARKAKATKPDCDNLAKSTCDALNELLFDDDGQIVKLSVEKWHGAGHEQPHVDVVIEELAAFG
jgi:Holliday junction resolvase RusA-like endonuclease